MKSKLENYMVLYDNLRQIVQIVFHFNSYTPMYLSYVLKFRP